MPNLVKKQILPLVKISIPLFLIALPLAIFAATAAEPNIELQIPILGFTQAQNIATYIKAVYQAATYIVVPFVIIIIILGGIEWLTAAGRDPEGMNKAKTRIFHGLIGLGIVLISYVLLSFVGITELIPPAAEYIPPAALGDGGALDDYPPYYAEGYTAYNQNNQRLADSLKIIKEAKAAGAPNTCLNKTFGLASYDVKTATWTCESEKKLVDFTCTKINSQSFLVNKLILPIYQKICTELTKNNVKNQTFNGDNGGTYGKRGDVGKNGCRGNVNAAARGTVVPSMHAYGIAIDIDPFQNLNCRPGTAVCKPAQRKEDVSCTGLNLQKYKAAKAKYGISGQLCAHANEFGCLCNMDPKFIDTMIAQGFRWGAYNTIFDAMHFETFGTCPSK